MTRRLVGPALLTMLALAVLIGLGSWQVHRLTWKRDMLAAIERSESEPAVPFTGEIVPFAKVTVAGRFDLTKVALFGAEVRQTQIGPTMGARMIVPLLRDGAPPVLVDRGWVPEHPQTAIAQPDGQLTVTGFVRPGESPGWFSASDDTVGRRFFTLDPGTIGSALGLTRVEPFVLVALTGTPNRGWPDPAHGMPRPPNNHLIYAITWYGLAVVALVVFTLWARGESRS